MSVKIVHAADFHLDSAFGALSGEQARQRRRESRELLTRLANYVNQNGVDVVLLAGDLFDSDTTYRETLEALSDALGAMRARVFIAPGNHDPYSAKSPYATLAWPENVHVFSSNTVERVVLPELSCAVYGAAFTASAQEESLLANFHAPEDGLVHLMVLHGDLSAAGLRYDPITKEQIGQSGLDYLALGHTHQFGGFAREGKTTYAYSGCPEGRGFDELGEKGILAGSVGEGTAELSFVPFARRRYEILRVDVTGRDAESALRAALPESTARDSYRVIFTGETDERGLALEVLRERFAPDFFSLELRDETRIGESVWARASVTALPRSTGATFEEENHVDLVQPTEKGRKIPAPRGGRKVCILLCRAPLRRAQPIACRRRCGGENAAPLSQNEAQKVRKQPKKAGRNSLSAFFERA